MKKLLTILLSFIMVAAMLPTMAFAEDADGGQQENSVYKYTLSDWQTSDGSYGSAKQDADSNVVILKGHETLNSDNSHQGPFAKPEAEMNKTLAEGTIVREINFLVGPNATAGGSVTVTASLNNDGQYLTEMLADFRPDGDGNIVYSPYNISSLAKIEEDDVYTVRWEYSYKDGNVYGKQSLMRKGEVIAATNSIQLTSENKLEGEKLTSGYMWFSNITGDNGVRVFTELPEERTLQEPYKYTAKDWTTEGGYGEVEALDNGSYVIKGDGTNFWDSPKYAVGSFSKAGNQSLEDGNIVQELNIVIDPADEDSYVDNGVKFALSCALNDSGGNRATEISYALQKNGDAVSVIGTDIKITTKDVYTFRIENTRDIFGYVYGQLKVLRRGELVGQTEIAKMSDLDATGTDHNQAAGHRYIWISSINVKNGIKVYTEVPAGITLNKETLQMTEGETAELTAIVNSDCAGEGVTWTTSDENIAAVDNNGKVTAVKSGTATIAAETNNGLKAECTVTVKKSSAPVYPSTPVVQKPVIEPNADVTADLSADGTTLTLKANDGYEITDVIVNGISKGAVDKITGLKTGDTVVIVTQKKAEDNAALIEAVKSIQLVARSTNEKAPSGKKAIKVYWFEKNGKELNLDGYEIYRSTKKNSGYGTKPIYKTTKSLQYFNTSAKKGTRYYYKVRGYKMIEGEKIYTDYSLKAIRTAK